MLGLKPQELETIKKVFRDNNVDNAIIFGSRAKGNYKKGSDIDIAVDQGEKKLSYLLNEETNLPYFFDVVNRKKIKNKNLLEHIERAGVRL